MNGKMPSSDGARMLNSPLRVEDVAQQHHQHRRDDHAAGRPCADRAAAGAGRAARWRASSTVHALAPCRCAADAGTRCRDPWCRCVPSARPGFHGRARCPSRISSEGVAALRLVHDVTGDEQRDPLVGQPGEKVPQLLAQHRIEARRSARRATSNRGVPSRATARLTRDRSPPDSVAGEAAPYDAARSTSSITRVHIGGRRAAGPPRSSGCSPAPSGPGRPRRLATRSPPRVRSVGSPAGRPSDVQGDPLRMRCTPITERISVVLPQPLGPSRPVTVASRHLERSARTARSACPRTTTRSRAITADHP